ncbi:hypothetical protein A5906_14015 [Bradyrhizobium sacchari]|uniref:Uncharacterized protein n=1 Tax=Bradyrhizobium sacchari TaxID=1399419 RepID=A0A560KC46_9BRAD|nr:hypothetical protein A5906_14015 [Bradyrhizobium sacchari]TWB64571.1 hypothetical protein FBZ94_102111 [Bradyrhizobium sacchari]TWB80895.1 hypothetical protein FBZ95_102112 [Bradyrhizobium sacchari]
MRSDINVAVEQKLDRIGSGKKGRLFYPDAVLHVAQVKHGVPTVRTLPDLVLTQGAEIQANEASLRVCEQHGAHGNDSRQNLRRPEDGLFKVGLTWISCEKPTPNACERQASR